MLVKLKEGCGGGGGGGGEVQEVKILQRCRHVKKSMKLS